MEKVNRNGRQIPKVVIDTNVWLSALITEGICRQILTAWKDDKFQLISSQELIHELKQVGERESFRKYFEIEQLYELTHFIKQKADIKELSVVPPEFTSSDPLDNIFVAYVLGSDASVLVTGNVKHFLNLRTKCEVLTPGDFLAYLGTIAIR